MWLKNKRWILVLFIIIISIQLSACSETESPAHEEPALLEEVEGSEFNRVILTARAAERLGIVTDIVRAGQTMHTQPIEGQVVAQEDPATESGDLVRVAFDKNTLSKVDSSLPARILLQADDEDDDGFFAELFEPRDSDDNGDEDDEDDEDEETLYFVLENAIKRLNEGQSVFVSLALAEGESQGSVIPYSAVIYGLNGETWAYTNPEPLTYLRQPITVDYIEGGQAFLTDGPPVGSPVVTVGAQMLYGTDTGVGK